MRNVRFLGLIFNALALVSCINKSAININDGTPADYVNSMIGTARKNDGGTQPGITWPFGMTQFVAMTHENRIGSMPYIYEDTTIIGFIATHQPTVWMGDYGYVSLMPEIGKIRTSPQSRGLSFNHKSEIARPYYYSVIMNTEKKKPVKAEITATSRCGLFQFTFPEEDSASFVIQAANIFFQNDWSDGVNYVKERMKKLSAYIKVNKEKNEISGFNPDRYSFGIGPDLPGFNGYFIIQFDKSFSSFGTWSNDSVFENKTSQYGTRMGAFIRFSTNEGEKVRVKIATSFISIEQARINLEKEIPSWSLEEVAQNTKSKWNELLGRIQLETPDTNSRTVFYTALYHCFLYPREFSEYGKYYSAFDDKIHDGISYNDYSLWDTYRALHPLLIMISPERVNDMITALLQMYKEGGWMPKWPNPTYTNEMNATHADAVIADAFVKGFRGYDVNLAYEAMHKDAFVPPTGDSGSENYVEPKFSLGISCPTKRNNEAGNTWWERNPWAGYEGRAGLTWYIKYGFIPCDYTFESVSNALEGTYDDYCVAQVAKALGKTSDYEVLMARSKNYKNHYNPKTGMMAARLSSGKWFLDSMKTVISSDHSKYNNLGFTEGSPWTYLFSPVQDIPGLIELMGGNQAFSVKLDSNFINNHYVHSNEPGHHYIYLYDYCGQAWKTQELVRKHTRLNYLNQPDGINGNDDCGQMSAWYIYSSMGFYPVCPGNGEYAIGAPQFPKIKIYLNKERTKVLEIIAKNFSEQNIYVQSVSVNGHKLSTPFLKHVDIANGGNIVFEMIDKPVK